jgi:aminopeptidase N
MKKLLIRLLIFGQMIGQLCIAQSPPTTQIDVKHITLDLRFDWSKRQAFGTATITITPLFATDSIGLDAAFMTIYSVSDANKTPLKFNYIADNQDNKLTIKLCRRYDSGENIILKIDYRTNYENRADPNAIGGSFGKGLRFFQPTSTTPTKRKQIWSSGEPENNKYWFPCHEDIADIHTTEIYATIEKPLMVISNGKLIENIANADGTQTFHYKSDVAFPNYLVSIVVGEYANIKQQSGKTIINNFGYPDEKEAVKATVALLPEMMQFLESKTGFAYPFENYSQVVVQDYPFPGLVGQHTASLLSDNYIDDLGVHQDFKYLWDGVAVQALANQWFGNLIMPKSWTDIWLNNAFAQYFAGLFTAKDNGNAEYLLWYYPFEKGAVMGDWEAGYKHPIVPQKITDVSTFTSDNYSKFRGALVLRMLQCEMGEELWWKSVQYFVKNNAYKQVNTQDFQAAIEKVSQKSYQWFFDQWIYKVGLPAFEISKRYDATKKQLSLTVKQNQTKENNSGYSQIDFFEGKIKIEIDRKIETVYLKAQQENAFSFQLDSAPKFVNFNYEHAFLCETKDIKSKEEYLVQLQQSTDVLAKQEAGNQLVSIANDSTTTAEFKQKIREALVNEIQSKQYWRYRMWALGALSKIAPLPYDNETIALLKKLIQTEKSWLKSTAINILGNTKNADFIEIYTVALHDESDRVINSAAIALGKTKSPKVYELLMNLESQPSWKNQNRISALNGLQQLGDVRAVEYALNCIKDNRSPRWYLATPVWDYPFAAVNTLVALGKADLAYPILFERFKKSLKDDDLNDIFQNVQLIDLLKDARAKEMYDLLKEKFKNDANVMNAVNMYEEQFKNRMKD